MPAAAATTCSCSPVCGWSGPFTSLNVLTSGQGVCPHFCIYLLLMGFGGQLKTTAPVQENLTPWSTRVHCCRREQNGFVHWQRSRTQCPGVHQRLSHAANGVHSPRSHRRREPQAPQVDCD